MKSERAELFKEGKLTESLKAAETRAAEASPEFREKLYKRIKDVHSVIIRAAIPREKVIVARQPEDILGKVQNEFAYIDPVAFKDPEVLLHTLSHEKQHLDGIDDDGLVELVVHKMFGVKGTPAYRKKIEHMTRVTELLGVEAVAEMYKDEDFHILLARFKAAYFDRLGKKPSAVTLDDHRWVEDIFKRAFPQLEILRQREFDFNA